MKNPQFINILLVEDDDIEAEAIQRAFAKADVTNPIFRARDGIEALEMLRGTNGKAPLKRPNLILLDLNMPRMNGIEFLQELRTDPRLSDSIVFVLTTSDDDKDRTAAWAENISGYFVKAGAGKNFLNMIDFLESYWQVVEFPGDPR